MLSVVSSFFTCRKLRFCKVNAFTQVQKLISGRGSPRPRVFYFKFRVVNCSVLLTEKIYSSGNFFYSFSAKTVERYKMCSLIFYNVCSRYLKWFNLQMFFIFCRVWKARNWIFKIPLWVYFWMCLSSANHIILARLRFRSNLCREEGMHVKAWSSGGSWLLQWSHSASGGFFPIPTNTVILRSGIAWRVTLEPIQMFPPGCGDKSLSA